MGGQSEELLGRWRKDRGIGDEIKIATKVGGRPLAPGPDFSQGMEPLTAANIRASAERSLERMGLERLDLYYAHVQDLDVPLEEQVEAFGQLASDGTVGLLGASNHWAWRVERARTLAQSGRAADVRRAAVLAQLPRRTHRPARAARARGQRRYGERRDPQPGPRPGPAPRRLLAAAERRLRARRQADAQQLRPRGTPPRLAALTEVVKQTGATPNQVVLSWLIGGDLPVVPLVGASSVAQLDETLAAVDLDLTAEQRALLDTAV